VHLVGYLKRNKLQSLFPGHLASLQWYWN